MLQQTQVVTVIAYFTRFIERFPSIGDLARAEPDAVMSLWTGLGYYSRARNLHACARKIEADWGGEFPQSAAQLQTLPGIGRSTAAAIAAICFGERVAILDGNVKRVLTRVLGYDEDLAVAKNERGLWDRAQALLPTHDPKQSMPRYTQAVMDLGATVCLPRAPECERCPVAGLCVARSQSRPQDYPVKTRKLKRTSVSIWLLLAKTTDGAVWLSLRPTPGVWAGLYSLEPYESLAGLCASLPHMPSAGWHEAPAFCHVLTHKDLHLHPVTVTLPRTSMAGRVGRWFAPRELPSIGLPAPIKKLLA